MEHVSLLPPEIKKRRIVEKRQGRVLRIGVLVIALLVLANVFLLVTTILTRNTLHSLQDEREELEAQAAELREYEELYNEMSAAENRLNTAMGNVPDWSRLLLDIGQAINPEASINDLSLTYVINTDDEGNNTGSGSFDMSGWSYSHGNVADMLGRVQRLEQLDDVRCRVSQETTIQGRRAVEFDVDADLLPGPVFFDPDGGGS